MVEHLSKKRLMFLALIWCKTLISVVGQAYEDCSCEDSNSNNIVIERAACDPTNATYCSLYCGDLYGTSYLSDKCCVHSGKSASLLAFEPDEQWVPRLEEFNKCTGASVRLEYLPEGEDGMAEALRTDVGDDIGASGGASTAAGEGIFDAYIVQGPWLPPVVHGLANLSPLIRANADTVNFLDINPASRSAVSFNGTVRALPLDTDYVAIGWRQDVFHKHGVPLRPPKTIEELADLSERLNGLDHNDDGEPDWGVCITPQVNYFYAFIAPIMQTQLHDDDNSKTGQNIFFDPDTFEPLIRLPGFRYGLEQYWRVIRSSNCQEQLRNGEKCDRKTAFPTGRCAMVISMPGTLTSMLSGSRTPADRVGEDGNVSWSIHSQDIGTGGGNYWGRRARFPGSTFVQPWDKERRQQLVTCDDLSCPHAEEGVNFSPFFAEGGEAYAINGRQSKPAAQDVMWDVFTWLSDLPVTKLPLSGQYRKSHLNEEARQELLTSAEWPEQMVDDLFELLTFYFKGEDEGGNPAQDLLMLGFPEYMSALDEELHHKFLGVELDSNGGLFDKSDPSRSVDPQKNATEFDAAFDSFVDALEQRYVAISRAMSGGQLAQLQRWRQSLNLPWRSDVEICSAAIAIDVSAFHNLDCVLVVDMMHLCQAIPADVAELDPDLCQQYYGSNSTRAVMIAPAVVIPLLVLLFLGGYMYLRHTKSRLDSLWAIDPTELIFDEPPQIIGYGTYGLVLLAQYRGTTVAVKRIHCSNYQKRNQATTMGIGDYDDALSSIEGDMSADDSDLRKMNRTLFSMMSSQKSRDGIGILDHLRESQSTSLKSSAQLREEFKAEMILLSQLHHPSITTVMGAVVKKGQVPSLVLEYMELGSLHAVLHNNTIDLDGDLVLPILQEISSGIRFLHKSEPQIIHGDLKSNNILIDAKFSAKVADFGLSTKKKRKGVTGTPLWMAPELLRGETANTAASDVYSFGIILYEVYSRKDPYDGEDLRAVLDGVADPNINTRPPIPSGCPPKMADLMKECLDADPKFRPSFEEISLRLHRMSTDNAQPGEMHLSIRARKELKASQANNLLYNVFPPHIAEALRAGHKVEPEHHDSVTIFFSDIVGYTALSGAMSAEKVCDMLDRLYSKFDDLCGKHEVFKMETIGDAYMAITNIAKDQSADSVKRVALFSIEAIEAAGTTLIDADNPGLGFVEIRVGFHTGPVTANVVGTRLPKYGVYGDTVNTASRMESTSIPGNIHCSKQSAKLLQEQAPEISISCRGRIDVKGKGRMTTYWINNLGSECVRQQSKIGLGEESQSTREFVRRRSSAADGMELMRESANMV